MITTPYPWPWHGRLDPSRLALLAVACPDRPAGGMPGGMSGLEEAVRGAGGLVVRVGVRPPLRPAGPPAAPPSTAPGAAPECDVAAAGWDGFHGSGLDDLLRAAGRDLLALTGCCLELGVHSTMRSANDRGYECLLVADACTAADPTLAEAALFMIEMSGGIFGAVGSSAALIRELS
ncbi:isochorismatase family protein [Microbispora amethystogenes]|uniref:cysteine hydrolase family protein n=1 Tax=Microbispora amethystogenes TaxID=1427754 RepID=UPI0033FF9F8E